MRVQAAASAPPCLARSSTGSSGIVICSETKEAGGWSSILLDEQNPSTQPAPPPPFCARPAGLGPTLEFYTLLSHELQRRSLGIWRHTETPGGSTGDAAKPAAAAAEAQAATAPAAAAAAAAAAGGGGGAAPAAGAAARRQSGPGPLAGELGEEAGQHEGVRASELVVAPQGLFPAPLPPGQRGEDSKVRVKWVGCVGL